MIYILILMVLALFALMYDVLNVREGRGISYWGAYLILVCLAGFRFKVGGDTYNYMYTHEVVPDLSNLFSTEVGIAKLQPLWLIFSATAKSIGNEFYILQFLHGITVNAVVFLFISKNTNFRHTGALFYYFALYPFFNFEILREALAVCCFLIAIPYYTNRNWIRYYALITAAFLFHLSAVFLFLLPIIRNRNFKPTELLMSFLAAAMLNPLFQATISSSSLTDLLGFAIGGYAEYNYTLLGLASIFALYLLVPLGLSRAVDRKFRVNVKYGEVANKGLLIAALIPLLFIFYRFFNYFSLLYLLMACEVANRLVKERKIRKIQLVTVPLVFSIALIFYAGRYFSDTSEMVASTRWHIRWHPYHSMFDPITVPDRDRMIEIQSMGPQ